MRHLTAWLVPLTLVGCGSPADQKPAATQAAEPIDQIIAGLRPTITIKGAAAPVRYTLAERMAHYKVPGVSVAVVNGGKIAWARGFGVKEAGTQDSVVPTTLFQAASISKPVSATAMLRLVDQGKLSLDSNVNIYLKSWKLPDNKFTAKEKVTLRRIVSHNAGLTVHGFPGYKAGDSLPTVPQILDGAKPANTGPVRVDTFPGAIWRYSGGGTTIMQLVLTDVTGEAFPDLVKRLVLDPAGMTNSTYTQPLMDAWRGRESAAHEGDGTVTPGRWHTYPEMAPAGLWTTPTDLLKWAMEITADRDGKSDKMLSKAIATEMLTVQKAPTGLGPFLDGSGRGFHFGHGGSNQGFRSELIYFPETGQGAAVMTNGENGGTLAQEILYSIGAAYQWPEYGPKEIVPIAVDTAMLDRLVGSYETKQPFPVTLVVSREGTKLFAEAEKVLPRSEIVLTTPTKATGLELGFEFTFVPDKTGKIGQVEIPGVTLKRKVR